MISLSLLEWAGSIIGILGAGLLAIRCKYSGYGFVLFLISNVFLITYAQLTQQNGIVTMQIAFTLTSILGIYRWLFEGTKNKE